jgi:hypothetical protein
MMTDILMHEIPHAREEGDIERPEGRRGRTVDPILGIWKSPNPSLHPFAPHIRTLFVKHGTYLAMDTSQKTTVKSEYLV